MLPLANGTKNGIKIPQICEKCVYTIHNKFETKYLKSQMKYNPNNKKHKKNYNNLPRKMMHNRKLRR